MARVESREFEPPPSLPTERTHPGLAVLGVTAFRGRRERFGILPEDRLRHLAVLGKTGMGKSTMTFATQLAVPADASVGSYSATLTVSVVSGP